MSSDENSRKTRERLLEEELEIVEAVNEKIQIEMNLDQVLTYILEAIQKRIPMDAANIALIDWNTRTIKVRDMDYSYLSSMVDYSSTIAIIQQMFDTRFQL
ncbi:MAG: hypothetical protein D6B26_00460, partial [Spirochaetaceae bacterium]